MSHFGGHNSGAFTLGLAVQPPNAGPIRHGVVVGATAFLEKGKRCVHVGCCYTTSQHRPHPSRCCNGHQFSGGCNSGACTSGLAAPPPSADLGASRRCDGRPQLPVHGCICHSRLDLEPRETPMYPISSRTPTGAAPTTIKRAVNLWLSWDLLMQAPRELVHKTRRYAR